MKRKLKINLMMAVVLTTFGGVGISSAQDKKFESDMVLCESYRGGILDCDTKEVFRPAEDVFHVRTKRSDNQTIYKVKSRPQVIEEYIAVVEETVTRPAQAPKNVVVQQRDRQANWEYRSTNSR